jgi:hypothetical protein
MRYFSKSNCLVLFQMAFVAALLLGSKTAAPQTGVAPREAPQPCIIVSEIEESSVLTNTIVALKMRDGRRLRMHLENSCSQLKFHGRFAFRAQGGQLCVGRDMLVARSGEPCRIIDFETDAETG